MELHHFSQSVLTWHPPRLLVTVNYVLLLYVVAEHLHLFIFSAWKIFLHQSEEKIQPYLTVNSVKRGSLKFLRKNWINLWYIPYPCKVLWKLYKKLITIYYYYLFHTIGSKSEFCNQIFVVFGTFKQVLANS